MPTEWMITYFTFHATEKINTQTPEEEQQQLEQFNE